MAVLGLRRTAEILAVCNEIKEIQTGNLAAMEGSHVHDVIITKEAPNYRTTLLE